MPKHHNLAIYIVVFLTEFTSPHSLNTQRGWHTSEFCELPTSHSALVKFKTLHKRWEIPRLVELTAVS